MNKEVIYTIFTESLVECCTRRVNLVTNPVISSEWVITGKCLRQVEHLHGHLWHRYSITVNQVMVPTVKPLKRWLQLNQLLFLLHFRLLVGLVLCLWFVDRCLSLCVLFRCLSFFDWRILITHLVSSNSFYTHIRINWINVCYILLVTLI
jgi:hypothetical protein